MSLLVPCFFLFFFFHDPATTEIYTLSLHDALPISEAALQLLGNNIRQQLGTYVTRVNELGVQIRAGQAVAPRTRPTGRRDRKSTRLNSSHVEISYAVFCLKKKKKKQKKHNTRKTTT